MQKQQDVNQGKIWASNLGGVRDSICVLKIEIYIILSPRPSLKVYLNQWAGHILGSIENPNITFLIL